MRSSDLSVLKSVKNENRRSITSSSSGKELSERISGKWVSDVGVITGMHGKVSQGDFTPLALTQ